MPYDYTLRKSSDINEEFGHARAADDVEALLQIRAYRRTRNLRDIRFEICADQEDPAATFFLDRTEHRSVQGAEFKRIWVRVPR
jgi:hypothetical protein